MTTSNKYLFSSDYRQAMIAIVSSTLLLLTACGGGGDTTSSAAPAPAVQPMNTPTNSAPTGTISITGQAVVGQTLGLEQNLADANGLGAFSYQWRRLVDNSHQMIFGATNSTYQVTSDDVGVSLSVQISYTDSDNFSEAVSSGESAIVVAAQPNTGSAGKPNILLIIADDQGVDASAQYSFSNDLPVTPHIDALAERGIVFDNVWATPACTTTRGTIITGQHGINSGVDFVPAVLDSSKNTLQRQIKSIDADYQTAVIGKWHLGGANPDLNHPTDSGVDYYAGTITGTLDDYYQWQLTEMGQTSQRSDYHTTGITDIAIDWLAEQNSQEKPWFLWLAYVAPHSPFHLPPAGLHSRSHLSGSASDIQANRREYYLAAIEAMDTEIGRLLNSLPESERDNTLIVYIGDNGTPAGVIDTRVFTGSHSKNSLYEGGVRVPMVASGFGVERSGEREAALVNSTDIYATISQMVGGSNSQLNNSYSFQHLLAQQGQALRAFNYTEFIRDGATGWTVRNDDYKLLALDGKPQALYQVSQDINETQDLVDDTSLSGVLAELNAEGRRIRNQ